MTKKRVTRAVNILCSVILVLPLVSCGTRVSRSDVIKTGYKYAHVKWTPTEAHILHGKDSNGIMVNTPDKMPGAPVDRRSWWKTGSEIEGMPYQWGGFDTPQSFLKKIAQGKKAGDVADSAKLAMGDSGVSKDACGVDCSGFVSRCWNLKRPYAVREMSQITVPISWDELKPGDMLMNDKHVMLFYSWVIPGKKMAFYDAGPIPTWKVKYVTYPKSIVTADHYKPYRYIKIKD